MDKDSILRQSLHWRRKDGEGGLCLNFGLCYYIASLGLGTRSMLICRFTCCSCPFTFYITCHLHVTCPTYLCHILTPTPPPHPFLPSSFYDYQIITHRGSFCVYLSHQWLFWSLDSHDPLHELFVWVQSCAEHKQFHPEYHRAQFNYFVCVQTLPLTSLYCRLYSLPCLDYFIELKHLSKCWQHVCICKCHLFLHFIIGIMSESMNTIPQ